MQFRGGGARVARRCLWALIGGALAAGHAAAAATPVSTVAPAPPREDAARFVGSAACAPCHSSAYERWQASHHAAAMQPATEQTVRGNFDNVVFTHAGVTSRFFRRDGKFVVHTDGPDGTLADFEVVYTFGVEPLQQYLIAQPGGRYQALGMAWSTERREWFHLYPTDTPPAGDPLHWTGPAQNWNAMCADCHSTNLQRQYDLGARQYATTWSEISVGCEACHGPGSAHLAWAQSAPETRAATPVGLVLSMPKGVQAAWVFEGDSGIAVRRPARTSHVEVDTCAPCHARRTALTTPYVFGRPLLDTHRIELLDEGLYHADGQVDDEVYVYGSFVQSKMYRAGVTCSDCHDPHSGRLRAADNALCARCHLPQRFDTPAHHFHKRGAAGSRCVDCHMPAKTFMVVDPRRDHSFRVPRPAVSRQTGSPDVCTGCHSDRNVGWAERTVTAWRAGKPPLAPHYAEAIAAGRRSAVGAEQALAKLVDDTGQAAIVRATALSLLGRYVSPASAATIERAAADADPFVRLGALEGLGGLDPASRLRLAFPLLRDPMLAIRVAAVSALSSVPAEMMTAAQRQAVRGGLEEHRAAQLVNADRPGAHVAIGLVYAQLGDRAGAQKAYERALEIGPYFIPAYVNLADLYRLQQRDDRGEELLRRALTIVPDSADVHHALGLLLARRQRTDEAVAALRQAAKLDPGTPRYVYVYAISLHSTGRPAAALQALEAAYRSFPGDRDIVAALATINSEQGSSYAAALYAQRLVELRPHDASARRLLEQVQARGAAGQ